MSTELSPNTKAILLLTAPLIAGRGKSPADLLTPGEYKRLARHLRELKREPADLISSDATEVLQACQPVVDIERLQRLLARGFLLSQVNERWQTRAIWVVSRADVAYPRRIKARLREDAPAVIYGCGDRSLLECGGLAVVGSRHVDEALIDYTMGIGNLAARARRMIVSGGAKGIDQAAMRGALESGGRVCGVLADSLEKRAMNRDHRNLLLDGQLVLISPYDPSAGFNVGNAMQRNKLIYALSDAALVVSSDLKKGGTWTGAVEQIDKFRFVPVFVRATDEPSPGLDALKEKGALPWPNPEDSDSLAAVLDMQAPPSGTSDQTESALPASEGRTGEGFAPELMPASPQDLSSSSQLPESPSLGSEEHETPESQSTPAELLFAAVCQSIRHLLSEPMKDAEVAAALEVSTPQARAWLQRLVDDGEVEKLAKPVRYALRQSDLFSREQ